MFVSAANAELTSPGSARPVIGTLIYPGMILLDLTGPLTVFSIMQADASLIGKTKAPYPPTLGFP